MTARAMRPADPGDTHAPALRGGGLALLAALLFGLSTPLIQRLGAGLDAFTTAALLYAGAAGAGALLRQPGTREAGLRRGDLGRLVLVAMSGALLGPVALAWGLQRTSGTSASLMLTLEAVFTAMLAWRLYGETLDRRVAAAMALLLGGGVALVLDQRASGAVGVLGLMAVLVATVAWGLDNALSRPLAERDPGQVVLAKAALGATCAAAVAVVSGEPMPGWGPTLGLLVVGATGYGLSLRLYLLAQRSFGAARTGSVFALAPFFGAAAAWALGERGGGALWWAGAALMLAGVLLHLLERHVHAHEHPALEHEHAHTHDDGHHLHRHDPMPAGSHSHGHHHEPTRHAHAHVPDAHHLHAHGGG